MTEPLCQPFDASSRLMLWAPHPDDETIAAGGLLQQVIAAGGAARVVYFTDGDNNPWPQRFAERRWRIGPEDRKRWGARRRQEALAALVALGVSADCARFLGYPDQRMTDLLHEDAEQAIIGLDQELRRWQPTHLLVPSLADLHPDHSAVAILAHLSLARWKHTRGAECLEYVVHGYHRVGFGAGARTAALAAVERARKRAAITCHTSQLLLTRRRIFAMAGRPELFRAVPHGSAGPTQSNHRCIVGAEHLYLRIPVASPLRGISRPRLQITSIAAKRIRETLRADLPMRSGDVEFRSGQDLAAITGEVRIAAGEWRIRIPLSAFGDADELLFKAGRRAGIFDESGWQHVRLPPRLALMRRSSEPRRERQAVFA